MKNIFAVKLLQVSKKYYVHHEKPTLMESVLNGKIEEFWALKKINLEIKKGEKIGIIGPNGGGKTTLLKIMARITSPTKGEVITYGKVISLIDLEAGFQPDLSGIQNIYLNGMLIGMQKDIIKKRLRTIISFADIGKFINAPLFTYSEGMKLRLGFAIAINADPDILILDENIAVGDIDFRKKSYSRIREYIDKGKTIIIVSHNTSFVKDISDRVIWLEKGKIRQDGAAKTVIRKYEYYYSKAR